MVARVNPQTRPEQSTPQDHSPDRVSTHFNPDRRNCGAKCPKFPLVTPPAPVIVCAHFIMKADIHPKYVDAEIRCACGNVIKTRSTKSTIIVGICNACHPFYTGQQKFVDTAGRVDKFQQRAAKTAAAQAAFEATKKKKK
jgi:ribosomal protein L31